MKVNYQSWQINPLNFPSNGTISEKIKFLAGFGLLAPSTHNSQPWRLQVEGNKLTIKPDFKKAMPFGDPKDRFIYLSLGAFLENILTAADYYKIEAVVAYPARATDSISVIFWKVGGTSDNSNHILHHVLKRATHRGEYKAEPLAERLAKDIADLAETNIKINLVAGEEQKKQLLAVIKETTPLVMSAKGFRKELAQYVKNNLTKSKLGMPAFVMGVPTILSFAVPMAIKLFNVEKFQKKKLDAAYTTPAFVVISSAKDDPASWVKTGQKYQAISLLANKSAAYTHPLAAPLHAQTYIATLQKILDLTYIPQFIFRVGHADRPASHGPRMMIDDCLDN